MTDAAKAVQRTYLLLTLFSTLSASFIWGINTLFLLDAGLNNTQAFAANAAWTLGQVIFEIPTGVIADTWGRRASYLIGAVTLLASTLLYLLMWDIQAPLWGWVLSSMLIGLGFTFFSGAVEAWLVDALHSTGYDGDLEPVFGKGQVVTGIAMLSGSVGGGFVAQFTNLGVPYIFRAVLLAMTFLVAFFMMKDMGFTPKKGTGAIKETKLVLKASIDGGWRNPPVRWLMLAAPFTGGVGIYAFYALQPYLLELYGDEGAFGIAGLAAAIIAGAQILGGVIAPIVRKLFSRRTHALFTFAVVGVVMLALIGWTNHFFVAIALLVTWSIAFAASMPIRQTYVNGIIPSEQRATVLSFDALMSSAGAVVAQPVLGRSADVFSYSTSYVIGAGINALALPFIALARKENASSDPIKAFQAPGVEDITD